jgi:DNA-binding transcriptional LysR family regulator
MKQSTIDLNALKTLVDVVAMGSFAAAARERNIPANTLSRQVQRLESDLGVRLMHRSTRQLSLTSSGRELVDSAKEALSQLELTLQEVGSQGNEPRGHLRIAVPNDFFSFGNAQRVMDFMEQNPAISLEFVLSDEQANLIENSIDLAIRVGEIRDETLVARRLAESRLVVVASPACVERHGHAQTPEALADYPCLASRGRNGRATWYLTAQRRTLEVEVQARFTANGMGALIAAAKAGLGAALVPHTLVSSSLSDGTLVRIMERYHGQSPGVFAVYPSRLHQPAALKAFVRFLVEEAPKAGCSAETTAAVDAVSDSEGAGPVPGSTRSHPGASHTRWPADHSRA